VTEPRLLLDEMLSGTIADQLRRRGYDVVAVVEDVSLVSTSDEELLAHATEQQRVLVTANIADFAAIASDWRTGGRVHHGIVYVAYRTFGQDGRSSGPWSMHSTRCTRTRLCHRPAPRSSCAARRNPTSDRP